MIEIDAQLQGDAECVLVVRVPRELNHESAEPLRSVLMRMLPNRDDAAAVLDLSAVVLVSSIGIAALLQVQEFCKDRGARLILASIPARQLAFFKMLKLDGKFQIARDVNEAIARIDAKDA